MKKYITTRNAKRTIAIGVMMFVVGYCLSMVSLFKVYDVGNKCMRTDDSICEPLDKASTLARTSLYIMYLGGTACALGFIGIILSPRQPKKPTKK